MKYKFPILLAPLLLLGILTGNSNTIPCSVVPVRNPLTVYTSSDVPILCYHNITVNNEKNNIYRISARDFEEQIKVLHDSGYQSITPDQLYDHIKKGTSLPVRPVMFTFDDTHETHFSIAANILEKYGYKGVFFIMTVCIGKRNYLKADQIKMLSEKGHYIECHTYDHPSVKAIQANQWETQIDKPKKQLERITGQKVEYFAYPFGVWNEEAIVELKQRGIKAAFQLTGKKSKLEPIYTIKRMMVPGMWSGKELLKQMTIVFKSNAMNLGYIPPGLPLF